MKTQEQWIELLNSLNIENRAFINGEYTLAISGQMLDVINPATDETLTEIARCQEEDVDLAVTCARQAFQAGEWSNSAPSHRKAVLSLFADLIDEHREELALLETLDTGKPINHSVS
ncbi:aldehyde dehydrogenase family protein, partial [Vibrio fortis]